MSIIEIITRIRNEGLAFKLGTSGYSTETGPHSMYAHVSTNNFTLNRGYAQDNGRAYCHINDDPANLLLRAYEDYRSRNSA